MTALTVGFAGMGRMGVPMALNLVRAGFDVAVWNRTAARCGPVAEAGAAVAATPAEVAAGRDVLITMVADGPAVEEVLLGARGALPSLVPGAVVLEMSTIGPDWARRLGGEARSRGVELLDAPVSGTIPAAESAQLVAMVGGDAAALERVRPVLAAMTKAQLHLGGPGAGATMKLAVNAAVAIAAEGVAEALALAEAGGIGREEAYEILATGVLASPFMEGKRAHYLDPDATPVGFALELMEKDVLLALGLAAERGVRLPATAAVGQVLAEGRSLGWGAEDLARVADTIRGRRGPGQGGVRPAQTARSAGNGSGR